MQGYIKLHRKLLDWEWYDDINTSRLFIHLLLTANHKDNNWRGITILRGERLTSLDKISSETGLSVSKIRTSVKKLISTNELASKSHTQHTVFIMKNYDAYQGVDKPIANESQTDDKPIATNKNDKNDKEEVIKTLVVKFSTDHMDFVKGMYSLILKVAEKTKEPNFNKWADDIRLMNEVDNLDLSDMANVFRWANQDTFWRTNILSPAKFRKQYSALHAKMTEETKPNQSKVTNNNISVLDRL